jgi:hypothetical protein
MGCRRYRMNDLTAQHATAEVPPLRRTHPFGRTRPLQHMALAMVLAIAPLAMGAGTLTARLSGPAPDGALELTIEAARAPLAEPDLSALERDFEVLASRNQHQSFMVNGRRSDTYSLILTLRPRRDGVTEVPAIAYGDDITPPLPLDSAAAPTPAAAPSPAQIRAPMQVEPPRSGAAEPTTGPGLVLEAEIAPQTVRVQQQAVLTARVLAPRGAAGTMARPHLYDPKVAGASVVPLGEDDYQTDRAGEPHELYERRYALFPTQAGTLDIGPLVADAWVGGPGVTAPTTQRASSPALTLVVEAAAIGPSGKAWLPARSVKLSDEQPGLARIRAGETWQRIIALRVEGQPASALPQLTPPAPFQLVARNGRPVLWDERLPDGVVGTRREVILVSGDEPGLYRLPEVRLDWWNTATGGWETAVLSARDMEVVAPAAPTLPPADPAQPATQAGSATDPGEARAAPRSTGSPWIWALIALGLGWLGVHALRHHRSPAPAPGPAAAPARTAEPGPRLDPLEEAMAAVREGYQARSPEAARYALLAWARLAWPHNPPGNLTQLALRCPEPTRGRITLLDQTFFSPAPLDWSHEPLWEDLPPIAVAAAKEPPPPPPKRRPGTPQARRT